MTRLFWRSLLFGAAVSLPAAGAMGGGPLRMNGMGPVVWKTTVPIPYKIDQGDLGPIPAATIQGMVRDAFQAWSDIPTANIEFAFAGLLQDDVESGVEYLDIESDDDAGNVVIFDDDGDIIADLTGEENRFRILGWANPLADDTEIFRFYSLMNGRLAVNDGTFLSTLIHEFGHTIGLDHSQIHAGYAGDGNPANDVHLPTMFPTSTDNDHELSSLNPDDVAWVSMLYPSPMFDSVYGIISGKLKRGNGQPVLGANITAIRQADTEHERFTCVSDYLARDDGAFRIPVMPGRYRIRIDPIRRSFIRGSSVGPHSENPFSPSFIDPVLAKEFTNPEHEVTAGCEVDIGGLVAD